MKFVIVILTLVLSIGLFGNSSATILNEEVTITVKPDGRVVQEIYQKVRMENASGYNLFGEWFYSYNPSLEEVKILKSDTHQKGGAVVSTPENGYLTQSPFGTQNAPDFSFMREQMVSHTGLEPGSVIEFRYVITDKKPFRAVIMKRMGGYVPVQSMKVTVKGVSADKILFNGDVKSEGNGVYTVKNVKPVLSSRYFRREADRPFVYVELKDPAKIIKANFDKVYSADDVKKLAEYAGVTKLSTECEVADAARSFVNKKLVDVRLDAEKYNFMPRSAEKIFKSGYATKMEKVYLIHSLLKYFGYKHSAGYLGEEYKGKALFVNPRYYIFSSVQILPSSLFTAGKVCRPFFGRRLNIVETPSVYSVSLNLKEGKSGEFSGTAIADISNGMAVPSMASLMPVKGVSVKNTKDLVKTVSRSVRKGKATLKTAKRKSLNMAGSSIMRAFHLKDIFNWTAQSESFTLPVPLKIKLHMVMETKSADKFITSKGSEIKNAAGNAVWKWVKKGESLEFYAELNIAKKSFRKAEFSQLESLLTPFLNSSNNLVIIK